MILFYWKWGCPNENYRSYSESRSLRENCYPERTKTNVRHSKNDFIEFFLENDKIHLKKYRVNLPCAVTGVVSEDNVVLADGNVALSKEGARILIDELTEKEN